MREKLHINDVNERLFIKTSDTAKLELNSMAKTVFVCFFSFSTKARLVWILSCCVDSQSAGVSLAPKRD